MSDVECMYTCAPGHIVDCSEFMSYIYSETVVSCVDMKELVYLAFAGHISCWNI